MRTCEVPLLKVIHHIHINNNIFVVPYLFGFKLSEKCAIQRSLLSVNGSKQEYPETVVRQRSRTMFC